jgi:hypothetical protein|tara:strand:+ start:209 stop:337 length:129 start_codon:yes stop_codon:yes gene_type:complete
MLQDKPTDVIIEPRYQWLEIILNQSICFKALPQEKADQCSVK